MYNPRCDFQVLELARFPGSGTCAPHQPASPPSPCVRQRSFGVATNATFCRIICGFILSVLHLRIETINMAVPAQKPSVNGVTPRKPSTPRAPVKKAGTGAAKPTANKNAKPVQQNAAPITNKAYSVAGESPASGGGGVGSAYAIMASRIANRVAEMAESITFVERYGLDVPQSPRWKQNENTDIPVNQTSSQRTRSRA